MPRGGVGREELYRSHQATFLHCAHRRFASAFAEALDGVARVLKAKVARIRKEMPVVQKKIGVKDGLQAFPNYMQTDPKFCAPETEACRALYLSETQKAQDALTPLLPQSFGILSRSPLVVKPVEAS
jgi:uncharacterized protein (DUF885 family)